MEHLDWLIGAGIAAIAAYIAVLIIIFIVVTTFIVRVWRSIERDRVALDRRMRARRDRRYWL